MKTNLKLSILILLTLFIVSLSVVSAATNTTTDITSTNNIIKHNDTTNTINENNKNINNITPTNTQKTNNNVNTVNNKESAIVTTNKETNNTIVPEKSSAANYFELRDQIANIKVNGSADKNYSIKLTGTQYKWKGDIGWNGIPSNLTIIGDTYSNTKVVLNGMHNGVGLFYLNSGHSITFINVTFLNGSTYYDDWGGAIINQNGTVNLINVDMINNTAFSGGAIKNYGTLNIYNSSFTGNIATTSGTKSVAHGGAISNYNGKINIYNSSFTGNIASASGIKSAAYGGAIANFNGKINIYNSTFSENNVTSYDEEFDDMYTQKPDAITYAYGGTIYNDGLLNCYNSNFINNSVKSTSLSGGLQGFQYSYSHAYGGVIYNKKILNIFNSTLTGNQAISTAFGDSSVISYCYGGAIYDNGIMDMNISKSMFNNNLALSLLNHYDLRYDGMFGGGGAIYTTHTLNMSEMKFINNSATNNGGAICTENNTNITKSVFINNTATNKGNVIYSKNNTNNILEDNWWGTNNPNWNQTLTNITQPKSWIYLKTTITKNNIILKENIELTNDFNWKTDGKNIISYTNNILDGLNITYTLNNNLGTLKPTITTIENGTSITQYTGTKVGTENITLKTENIETDNNTWIVTINPLATTTKITYITPNINPGSNMTIQATITDTRRDLVNTGEVVIKINGKTLQDDYGKTIRISVVNGTINYNYYIPDNYSTKQYNLTVKYLRNDNYTPSEQTINFTITKEPTSTKITYITPNITPGSNMTIQASITDKNKQPITTGEVVIKINGKTLKDKYGQSIKIPVINGTINYTYYIPENYSTKTYNITVKYLKNDKYTPSEQTINFTITKEPTSTKITYITPNITPGSNMTIQASITDKNKQPITTGELVIKINGKTLKDTQQNNIEIPVINGTINYTYHIPENYTPKTYNLTVKYLKNDKYTPSEQTKNFTITKTLTIKENNTNETIKTTN
ncbi:MAG: hypothetical protein Q4Q23_03465 [Methanobacteriaceae archaeon]|nr:hypothetical protein [Methanobacteriaceae archaeon]